MPTKIAKVHAAESRKVLSAYVTWHLLRRLRASSRRRPVTQTQVHGVRAYVIQVVRLLNWLHEQGVVLSSCTQDLLDVWLDDHPARGPRVHGFLVWTSRKGHTRTLTVDVPASAFTGQLIAQDVRWRLVDRLIHDNEITVADKAAGLLALLFAQGPFRITALSDVHIEFRGDEVSLRLGKVPILMPPPLDGYLRTLHAEAMDRDTAAERWLFPGRFPAQHLSSGRLTNRLRLLSIHPRMGRNTALIELASELPAVVVSRLLGIHQNTADAWQRLTGQDHTYAAEITHRAGHPSQDPGLGAPDKPG
ncbi:hypothetical protein C5L38_34290 (plasmid) [Streptomyces sp. WAC00288]|uniref:hypothetical protein n=1 Tax=unclassified Streptomyces TaxID=2593676 RepID=UPI000788E9E9|nr:MULTISPECIES: hypothetical protein [unclassified Streptomyces]AVI00132.1 hypothetical protein C5L38_34290 [Streptomyces sp. WAC00288]KYG51193.1 hypothetical protein AWI43_32705 [Streptomyces sp. WAC04657]